ncbi:DUF2750 domain-containing protein [Adhaeribacter terreus]|uniref:DUF2750 domain-containing protein n=1 Tax=Adhaeribacter terreus TaxID=529703 RepID=A0ABW0E9I3_9BACT
MNQHKIDNIFALDSSERYGYLLRRVADFETIYLIADEEENYVMLGSEDGNVLPVWPEKEFASLFLTDDWSSCHIVEYKLSEFMDWLDDLAKDSVLIAGFPNLDLHTVHVSAIEMKNHLLFEMRQYE